MYPVANNNTVQTAQQLPEVKNNWASFFADLPAHLAERVKKRDAVCSMRVLTNEETSVSIIAETIAAEVSSTVASDRLVVVVSGGARKTDHEGLAQEYQPGDFFFVRAKESYAVAPLSQASAVMIHFDLL